MIQRPDPYAISLNKSNANQPHRGCWSRRSSQRSQRACHGPRHCQTCRAYIRAAGRVSYPASSSSVSESSLFPAASAPCPAARLAVRLPVTGAVAPPTGVTYKLQFLKGPPYSHIITDVSAPPVDIKYWSFTVQRTLVT